jgi:hypothetical protein
MLTAAHVIVVLMAVLMVDSGCRFGDIGKEELVVRRKKPKAA